MKKYYEEPEVDMVDILVDDIMKVSGETEEIEDSRKKVDFPTPCPPTRQSMVSNLHPGWNTRLMAPSRKIFMASQVYSSFAAPRKWCRTWAIRSVPSHFRLFR